MMSVPVVVFALLLAFLSYRYFISPTLLSPLSKLPLAHPTSSFSGLWIWLQRRRGRESRSIFAAHQRCGPIIRLAPDEVSVTSLDAVKKIYGGGFERSKWFEQFFNYDGTPNLVTTFGREKHAMRRRMVSQIYSKSYLLRSDDFEGCVREVIFERLMPVLDDAVGKEEGLDVYAIGSAVGAEIVSTYAFGTAKGLDIVRKGKEKVRKTYLENGKKKLLNLKGAKYAAEILEEECLQMCEQTAWTLRKQDLQEEVESVEPIKRPERHGTYPVPFAQLIEQIPRKEGTEDFREVLRRAASEVLDNTEAGRVGIGIALTYAMHELSQHEETQLALRNELVNVQPPFTRSSCQELSSLTALLRRLDGLPLLDAVVTETLRLHPPGPGPQRREVPKGGAVIEGRFIPGGTTIHAAPYYLHRQKDVFSDAEAWNPERWIGSETINGTLSGGQMSNEDKNQANETDINESEESSKANPRTWLLHFSKGPRMCVGDNFAILVLKIVLAAIYVRYATRVIDDEGMEQIDDVLGPPVGDKLILEFKYAD
ncbi:cytochrome P450 [Rhizodiscina lignyota]|uniref:Cytochrome P450 n=1 Tax=Rhizodiscina lignyota TaxID=1504668 RepID=A0A9P4IBT7_9PEZI|nr:cytochrome P450 [Rhizodiscina lignyota]